MPKMEDAGAQPVVLPPPPAASPAREQWPYDIKTFRFQQELEDVGGDLLPVTTHGDDHPATKTTMAVEGLLNENHVSVIKFLKNHRVVQRFIRPVGQWIGKIKMDKEFKLQDGRNALGISISLFVEKKNEQPCNHCDNPNFKGPLRDCVAGGPDIQGGACGNCIYHGRGDKCSLRLAHEKANAPPEPVELDEDLVKVFPYAQLKEWLAVIQRKKLQRQIRRAQLDGTMANMQ